MPLSIGTDCYVPQKFVPQKAENSFGDCPYLYLADEIAGQTSNDEPTLAEELMAAVEAYKEKLLRGLGGLSDEEIEARIAEFIAEHKPEDGTNEELAEFYEKLLSFMKSLYEIKNREHIEKLLTTGGNNAETMGLRAQPAMTMLSDIANRYSQMLATQ